VELSLLERFFVATVCIVEVDRFEEAIGLLAAVRLGIFLATPARTQIVTSQVSRLRNTCFYAYNPFLFHSFFVFMHIFNYVNVHKIYINLSAK
jgi:hypothetical protein